MYVKEKEDLRIAGWQPAWPGAADLGQATATSLTCIPTPRWLTLFPHWIVQKQRLPVSVLPLRIRWKPQGVVQLAPGVLNPGTLDATTHALNLDPDLDSKLKALLGKLVTMQPPFDQEPFKSFIQKRGKIRVALVDLSTNARLLFPKIAEFDSATITIGASLAKIGALYAAHQLKFDLSKQAADNPASMTKDRISKLKKIFDITQAGTPPVTTFALNAAMTKAMDSICENSSANTVMRAVGFRYMNSALWQSDLYTCQRGGIWLGGLYDRCRTFWHGDPIGGQCHAVNALAVSNYFTLLAQGRLIDDPSSLAIKAHLVAQRAYCRSFFEEGLQDAGRFDAGDALYSKIGIIYSPAVYHEGALVERDSIGKKYAVTVLTIYGGGIGHEVLRQLIPYLDELVKNNP